MTAVITEQQAAHTPGPWSVCFDHPDPECRDSIAYIRPTSPVDGFWEANEIGTVYACDGSDERKANARLIAAAPDLLEALIAAEAALNRIRCTSRTVPWEDTGPAVEQARAAIAKATGAQS